MGSHDHPWSSRVYDRQAPLLLPRLWILVCHFIMSLALHLNDELLNHASLSYTNLLKLIIAFT